MKKYVPDLYYKNIYEIPYSRLKNKKIKTLLFDLDNTIIPAHEKIVSLKVKNLFQRLKKDGFHIIIFSNSPKSRLQIFEKSLHVKTNALSFKPSQRGFQKVFQKYHLVCEETAIIGDQILTDILGGNTYGILTILVTPITKKDFFLTKINRYRENRIMKKLEKMNLWKRGEYDE